jgi:DNA-binding MarR family transcriptional regulator
LDSQTKGKLFSNTFDRFMPFYFHYINPIIHKAGRLNANQVRVIMALNYLGRATPTELSNCFCMQKGSLTTILRSLQNMGLIDKQRAREDERKYYVSATQKAKALIKEKEEADKQAFEKLFSRMSAKDADTITQGLHKLCDYFDEMEALL